MTKIVILARSLNNVAGGVEKSVSKLANDLSTEGYNVTLLTLDATEAVNFYTINSSISWKKLNIGKVDQNASFTERFRRIVAIRSYIRSRNIDYIISFQSGITMLATVSAFCTKSKVVACERESLQKYKYIRNGKLHKIIHYFFLLLSDYIQVFFNSYIDHYPRLIQRKCVVIGNYIEFESPLVSNSHQNKIKLLYVGRLEYPKNLELLVQAVGRMQDICELKIIGNGSENSRLRELSANFENVNFKVASHDLDKDWVEADFLILISLWEGFPNVVLEALAKGIPVLGFKSTSGVRDLVQDNVNGLLSEEPISITSIANLINLAFQTKFDSTVVQKSVMNYDKSIQLNKWFNLLQ